MNEPLPTSGPEYIEQERSLLDLLIILAKYKWLVLGMPLVVGLVAVGATLLMPNIYTATTRILPPQQQSSATTNVLQQLGILAGLSSGAVRNPNDTFVGMLLSRTVADSIIIESMNPSTSL